MSIVGAASGEHTAFDLDRFFDYALDLFCIAGTDGYFKRVNPAFERTLGYTARELLSRPFVELIHPDDRPETVAEVGNLASGAPTLSFENRYRCKDGSYRDLQWTSFPEPGTGLLYAVARDVTERRGREDRVDRLTGVASRRFFDDTLPDEWRRAGRLRVPLALAYVDLDHFRDYNFRFGHEAGDTCLKTVADVLRSYVRRAGDFVARTSGGEFGLILQGSRGVEQATKVAEAIRAEIASRAVDHPGGVEGRVTVSIGLAATVPDGSRDCEALRVAARGALAEAKQNGRNRVVTGEVPPE